MKCAPRGASGAQCSYSGDCQAPLVCLGADFSTNTMGTCGNGADAGGACRAGGAVESGCKTTLTCDPATNTCVAIKFVGGGQACDERITYCARGQCSVAFDSGNGGDGGESTQGTCPAVLADGAPCDPTSKTQTCDAEAYCVNGTCQVFDPASCK
jgi:hypothetical protein